MDGAKQILTLIGLIAVALFVGFALISTIINNLVGFVIFGLTGIAIGGWFANYNFKQTELEEN